MPLSDARIRTAKPAEKPYKLADERGLYLLVNPGGGRLWRFKYRLGGKEKLLALGGYPDLSLKDARARRDEARSQLAHGIDPSAAKKAAKVAGADTFEAVAREWLEKRAPTWTESHTGKILRRFELYVFPWLGSRPVAEITAPELLAALRRIENRGALDTAHRTFQTCGQVFRYAVATGRAGRDPSADLRGALPPVRDGHFAAVTEPAQIASLLRSLEGYRRDTDSPLRHATGPPGFRAPWGTAPSRMGRHRPGSGRVAVCLEQDGTAAHRPPVHPGY